MTLNSNDQKIVAIANGALATQNWNLFEEVYPMLRGNGESQKFFGCPEYAAKVKEIVSGLVRKYKDALIAITDSSDWIKSDGGRENAGYKGSAEDCAVRAISIACDLDYQEIWDYFDPKGDPDDNPDNGVVIPAVIHFLMDKGWDLIPLRSEEISVAKAVQRFEHGLIICSCLDYEHFVAIKDSKYHDTWNSGGWRVSSILIPPK